MSSFIKSQFNHWLLKLMLYKRMFNLKLNHIKESVATGMQSSETKCEKLINKTSATHHINLHLLMIEIYKQSIVCIQLL